MKKLFPAMGVLAVCITSISQEIQHEAVAINIEVPVRVFKGDTFIDHLTIEDFEVSEDGALQKIEAVYLIKKNTIEREETTKEVGKNLSPEVSRHFVLAFEVINWLPKIADLVDHFFSVVYQPGDTLVVTTPIKTYQMNKKVLEKMPKRRICDQLKSLLRKDIIRGNLDYKSLLQEYKNSISSTPRDTLDLGVRQAALFQRLRDYKYFDESKMQTVSSYLKQIEGQKHIFLIYQKEELPLDESMNRLDALSSSSFDVDKIKRAFSDSAITVHFLFITNKMTETLDVEERSVSHFELMDVSWDVFNSFNEIAKTTGGVVWASANASAAFIHASEASENYYLLYYTPKDYKSDGKFRNIKVKVKNKNYRVLHRAGYLAD